MSKLTTCLFCDYVADDKAALMLHSAACQKHPLWVEVERLRHRLDKADGAMAAMNNSTGKAVGEKVAAMALATQLAKYADHDTSCPFDGLSPCNCGLGQLLIKAREVGVIP